MLHKELALIFFSLVTTFLRFVRCKIDSEKNVHRNKLALSNSSPYNAALSQFLMLILNHE